MTLDLWDIWAGGSVVFAVVMVIAFAVRLVFGGDE